MLVNIIKRVWLLCGLATAERSIFESSRVIEKGLPLLHRNARQSSEGPESTDDGRTLRFGYRAHVIVRETEDEARAYARRLLSKLDAETGAAIRQKSLDSTSVGVTAQAALREAADDEGFVEEGLWTGIGRARSGCGAAIVGDPDQVLAKLRRYQDMGIEAFILSGYPHQAEADLFARHVLPRIEHGPLI